MTIRHICSCGAELEVRCSTYINAGGGADDQGRVFVGEKVADKWLALHEECRVHGG